MICANPKCGKEFEDRIYHGRTKKYCSRICNKRHYNRLIYASDAELRSRISQRTKKWRIANSSDLAIKKKEYYTSNRDKWVLYNHKYNTKHWPQIKKKRIDQLSDWYVKSLLKDGGVTNPSKELIEEKRLTIKIKRLINEKQREINPPRDHGRSHNVLSGTTGN